MSLTNEWVIQLVLGFCWYLPAQTSIEQCVDLNELNKCCQKVMIIFDKSNIKLNLRIHYLSLKRAKS
ncbi:hypothetical protein BpHYR1_018308 [Brachionus plicatilis]|uniref:Uncharacterized protein n=1 Tax=Brachionus plicatilis TaxID=10195 RepID=A0A3M7RDA9_BRAPC|nr:hypothetical protein BpHYR1_018308 [Brachionus plicatilis]